MLMSDRSRVTEMMLLTIGLGVPPVSTREAAAGVRVLFLFDCSCRPVVTSSAPWTGSEKVRIKALLLMSRVKLNNVGATLSTIRLDGGRALPFEMPTMRLPCLSRHA